MLRTLLFAGLVLVAVGCAKPTPQSLVDARRAVDALEADSDVNRHASVQVLEAQQALQRANQNWTEEGDATEADHLSYLTTRRVEIARSAAAGAIAVETAMQLTRERDQVRLAARTSEVELALNAAEKRAAEAELARAEAEAARMEAEAAAERERKIREELAALQARETERGLMMTLGDVLFDLDKSTLKPGAMTRLDRLAAFMNSYPERSLLIEGHTDATGSDTYNLELSQRRADSVANFLVSKGVTSTRLFARGYGKGYPVAANTNAAGRQQNRRVEVVILEPGDDAASKMRPMPSS